MHRVSLLSWSLGAVSLVASGACSAPASQAIASDDELVDSRWIGTYRNNAAKSGELRTLALKGDGSVAIVLQECTATACSSVQVIGTYTLGERSGNERKLSLLVGAKALAYRTRLEAPAATVEGRSLALLELDASGIEKQPFVSMTLARSSDLWCATPKDCELQSGSRGPAADCIANACVWAVAPTCNVAPSATELSSDTPVAPGAPTSRRLAAAAWTSSGLFVFGGRSPEDLLLADGAVFDPLANTWQPVATAGAPSPRENADAASVAGKVIVAGGWSDAPGLAVLKDAFLYDLATKTWSPLAVPEEVAKDWFGDFYAVGGALYRRSGSRLLYRVDVQTGAITPVADPPEALTLRGPSGGIENTGMMHAVIGDSLAILVMVGKAQGGWDHNIWRLFELSGSTGTWSVADVGLGQIGSFTSMTSAGKNLVFVNGDVAHGGGGSIATLDMLSKSVKVTQIGMGDTTSSYGWLELFGSATSPNPAAVIHEKDHSELDTLDVSRAWFAHESSWRGTPPPRPKLPLSFDAVKVWTGSELLVWGGRAEQTVNDFKVVSYPRNVVRYTPPGCN